ncbi:MAG: response regulator, partial [Lachnospira eligens]|nr:response regulator [Lachnospira eligens]
FEKSEIDKEDQEKQKILNSFLKRNSQLQSYVMLVPTASWILKDLLPSGAPQGDEKSWYESWISTSKISELSNVTVVDCADELAEAVKTNQIYYRTDHHWTTYGASAAFKELAKRMDIPYEEDDFEAYTVHAKFQGTMMSSSGFYSGTKDTIDLYLPKEPETILVTNKEAQTTTTTIYSEEGLLGNDPYEVFLGGNYGLLNIQTSSQSGRKLLLLKDSYANAIIGFSKLALESGDMSDKNKDYMKKISFSGQNMLSLINDILDMSRIESGKIHLEETEVNLSDVLHDLKTIISGQIHAKQLDLYMDVMDVTDEDVYCDKTRLNQVLLNLLSNAVKFTPAGGTVSVRLKQFPGTVKGSEMYEIRVKDNGIGMSPEFVKKIFSPFERERTSTVSRTQGTGLGMAITKNIVDMMGGTIDVQTEQGKGTEFIVCLPFRIQSEKHHTEKIAEDTILTAAGSDFRGKRILLVEDNELNSEIAVELLNAYGFVVDTAENGAEAVEKVKNSTPGNYDLVLMDVQMPVMNGYEATKQIRALNDPALAGITILAMTANAFNEDRKKALECGMNGFLSKPIVIEELIGTLQKNIEQVSLQNI